MCSCGHHHEEFDETKFNEAVKKFVSTLPENINIDEEYEKIINKTSNLSRSQRDTIEAIVLYKKEHFGAKCD